MITVQADANKLVTTGEVAGDMAVLDSNESAFEYLSDAVLAITLIVVHAEVKYGSLLTNAILATLEGNTLRNKINEKRGEKANEDQTEDCPDC